MVVPASRWRAVAASAVGTVTAMARRPLETLTWEQWAELVRDLAPPTEDDVSITADGRRLDSKEAVIEFFSSCRPASPPGPGR